MFAVLDKVRLGAEHSDFYTLLAALTQVLEGIGLNAWRRECGFPDLETFLKSNHTPEQILEIAHHIFKKYATPTETMPPTEKPKKSTPTDKHNSDGSSGPEGCR